MASRPAGHTDNRRLAGHLSEFETLLATLKSEPGTTVLAGDPLSGTSDLARHAAEALPFAASTSMLDPHTTWLILHWRSPMPRY